MSAIDGQAYSWFELVDCILHFGRSDGHGWLRSPRHFVRGLSRQRESLRASSNPEAS